MSGLLRIETAHARGAVMALGAAVLFGASAPFSKGLLAECGPLTLAALLYLGAGIGLLAARPRRRADGDRGRRETALKTADAPLVAAAVLCGAILGPSLMMLGLQRVSAVTGSLLLNLEPPLTILIAVAWFGEHLGWRQAGAAALILLGEAVVGYRSGPLGAEWTGIGAMALACLSWSIDTNLNQRLSLRDPVALGLLKGFAGGAVLLVLALAAGERLPAAPAVVESLLLGSVSYGASIVLFYLALRELGAARVAAYFATAPFIGALTAVPVLGDRLHRADLAAMALMALGLGLLLRESHDHVHAHAELTHDHAHVHDEHHRHDHGPDVVAGAPHAHPHRHPPMTHSHPHAPDLHHRHDHP